MTVQPDTIFTLSPNAPRKALALVAKVELPLLTSIGDYFHRLPHLHILQKEDLEPVTPTLSINFEQ